MEVLPPGSTLRGFDVLVGDSLSNPPSLVSRSGVEQSAHAMQTFTRLGRDSRSHSQI